MPHNSISAYPRGLGEEWENALRAREASSIYRGRGHSTEPLIERLPVPELNFVPIASLIFYNSMTC